MLQQSLKLRFACEMILQNLGFFIFGYTAPRYGISHSRDVKQFVTMNKLNQVVPVAVSQPANKAVSNTLITRNKRSSTLKTHNGRSNHGPAKKGVVYYRDDKTSFSVSYDEGIKTSRRVKMRIPFNVRAIRKREREIRCRLEGENHYVLSAIRHTTGLLHESKTSRWRDDGPFEAQMGAIPKARRVLNNFMKIHYHSNGNNESDRSDEVSKEMESLILLFGALVNCKNTTGIVSTLALYVHSKFDKSMSKAITQYITELLQDTGNKFMGQADVENKIDEESLPSLVEIEENDTPETPLSKRNDDDLASVATSVDPDWLVFLKTIQVNFNKCKSSKFFKNFVKTVGLLITSGLFRMTGLKFEIGKFKLIEPGLKKRAMTAPDFIGSVIDMITYFTEKIYYCFKTGDVKSLLLENNEYVDLEKEYVDVCELWRLHRNGNMVNVEETEFMARVIGLEENISTMMESCVPVDRKILGMKLGKVKEILHGANVLRASGFRRAPFSFEIYGMSGAGKSTIADQLNHYLSFVNDLSLENRFTFVKENDSPYWDGSRSDMIRLMFDDVANEKAAFLKSSPLDPIRKACSNTPFTVPMADLSEKGEVSIKPELVSVTTNKLDLDASIYSNCPASLQRRMNVVIDVRPKPEFMKYVKGMPRGLDQTKAIDFYTRNGVYAPPAYHDLWYVTVYEMVCISEDISVPLKYELAVDDQGKEMKDMNFPDALNYISDLCTSHREAQIALESSYKEVKVEHCPHEGCNQVKGFCRKHEMESQAGVSSVIKKIDPEMQKVKDYFDRTFSEPFLPECVITNKWFCYLYAYSSCDDILQSMKQKQLASIGVWVLYCSFGIRYLPLSRWLFWFLVLGTCVLGTCLSSAYYFAMDEVAFRLRNTVTINRIRENCSSAKLAFALKTSVILSGVYFMCKHYQNYSKLAAQGSLNPSTQEELDARDKEKFEYSPVVMTPLPGSQKSREHTFDVVKSKVEKNLLYASFLTKDGSNFKGDVLFLKSNLLVVPNHYFSLIGEETLKLRCYKEGAPANGCVFETTVDINTSVLIDEKSDLRLCYTPGGGSYGDLTPYLPLSAPTSHPFTMMHRSKDGRLTIGKGYGKFKDNIKTDISAFPGLVYSNLSLNTFKGLCGAVLLSDSKETIISGIHLGGQEGKPVGCAGFITKEKFDAAKVKIEEFPSVLLTGNFEEFQTQVAGKYFMTDESLHEKSPVNYMPNPSPIPYHGSAIGRTTPRSSVVNTLISETVEKVFNIENEFGGPYLREKWRPYQEALKAASTEGTQFPHGAYNWAVKDYVKPLLEIAEKTPWCDCEPLTMEQAVNGVDGLRFMNALPPSTSIGYPFTGPKSNWMEKYTNEDGKECKRFIPLYQEYIDECHEKFKNGDRVGFVIKMQIKDEVLKRSKKKCRIFFAAPAALNVLLKIYFSWPARLIQMYPLLSECSVGINCHGPEWHEMIDHVLSKPNTGGGDFEKYDLTSLVQGILTSLKACCMMSSKMKYTEAHLATMKALASELAFALINCNGDLVSTLVRLHVSGNFLTVIINSIMNSLNFRVFFYEVCGPNITGKVGEYEYNPENCTNLLISKGVFTRDWFEDNIPSFRDLVALTNYGDDNFNTSDKEEVPGFTIKNIALFLKQFGLTYTMPDKESELQDYLEDGQLEFLKRKTVYHEKLDCKLGALIEDSIFKPLMCYMRGKRPTLTEEEACAVNMMNVLRESFNHGEEFYEDVRAKLVIVARSHGIMHMCLNFDKTYDNCVAHWLYKYRQVGEKPPGYDDLDLFEEITFDSQCGIEDGISDIDPCRTPLEESVVFLWFDTRLKELSNYLLGAVIVWSLNGIERHRIMWDRLRSSHLFWLCILIGPSVINVIVTVVCLEFWFWTLRNAHRMPHFRMSIVPSIFYAYWLFLGRKGRVWHLRYRRRRRDVKSSPVSNLKVSKIELKRRIPQGQLLLILCIFLVGAHVFKETYWVIERWVHPAQTQRSASGTVSAYPISSIQKLSKRKYSEISGGSDSTYDIGFGNNVSSNSSNVSQVDFPDVIVFISQAGAEGISSYQNVTFEETLQSPPEMIESVCDETRCEQDTTDLGLEKFLARPVKIATYQWGVGSVFSQSIDPWTAFFENKRVGNRISNYNLLRVDRMKIKVVINGNPFLYGRVMVNYRPYEVYDESWLPTSDAKFVQKSQMPKIFLDPTTSQGGEMSLPFFFHRNYLNVPDGDWSQLGVLEFDLLNLLRHANDTSESVTISVFAWVEGVSMSVLTGVNASGLIAQAGEETDEANSKGFISGPATSVAKLARSLTTVPGIGKFAMATDVTSTAIAGMAKVFGYSRPNLTAEPHRFIGRTTGNLAVGTLPVNEEKITLDDKQELSIDPRISGIGPEDTMNILTIAKKESYLCRFGWAESSPPETLLYNLRVSPMLYASEGASPKAYCLPALATAAMPFEFWTGTINFRFQVVCSAFHKGRLKLVYDPQYLPSDTEYNVQSLEIIDISEKNDFTVSISLGQDRTLLDVNFDSINDGHAASRFVSFGSGSNGVLGVYVVNELTTPNAVVPNDVEVNVFVSAGDDFEVFVPGDGIEQFVFTPQAGVENPAMENGESSDKNAPEQMMSQSIGLSSVENRNLHTVFVGESVKSFRTLLKRFVYHTSLICGTTPTPTYTRFYGIRNIMPYLRGNVPGAVDVAPVGTYNQCNTLLMHWLILAHTGWRGSIRHKLVPQEVRSGIGQIMIARENRTGQYLYVVDPAVTASSVPNGRYDYVSDLVPSYFSSGSTGAAISNFPDHHALSFETPFYSPYRFVPGKRQDYTSSDGNWMSAWSYYVTTLVSDITKVLHYVAVGEDFQCYFWTGLPAVFRDTAPNPP